MKRLTILYPFLFAIFPILSLYSSNVKVVAPAEILAPLAVVVAATIPLLLLATWLLGDGEGAAIVISAFWLLFFSYRRALTALGGPGGGRERYLWLACGLLFAAIACLVWRWRRRLHDVASIAGVVGAALVVMPLLTIVPALVAQGQRSLAGQLAASLPTAAAKGASPMPTGLPRANAVSGENLLAPAAKTPAPAPTHRPPSRKPNIFYIILDGYARADVLQELYREDNGEFLDWLAGKGFYVASQGRANYCQTYLSLASSLNSTYLDGVAARVGVTSDDRAPLADMVGRSAVAGFLKQRGYTYVAFSSGYGDAALQNADVYKVGPWAVSSFQSELVSSTPISPLIALPYEAHRQRLLYVFDHLPDMAASKTPVFVLAHIMAPHPPFVFGEHGERITPNREFMISDGSDFMLWERRPAYIEGYRNQLRFINGKIKATIEAILARSPEPPIIILQGDHGPGSELDWDSFEKTNTKERLSILNAYYLPDGGQEKLYSSITPVNTFRLTFDWYFGTDYGLLEDRSYYSTWDHPYTFIAAP